MTPGIIIASLTVLSIIVGLVLKHLEWKKIYPKTFIRGMGIKYTQGAIEWEGLEKNVDILYDKISAKYSSAYAQKFLTNIWIEIVGPNGSRICPGVVVSQATKEAGSIDSIRKWPWSHQYSIAVVLQAPEYKTANDGAVFHEITKHLLAIDQGLGYNTDHSNAELNALEHDMHFAYSIWVRDQRKKQG